MGVYIHATVCVYECEEQRTTTLCWIVCVTLTQAEVIGEEGTSVKKVPP